MSSHLLVVRNATVWNATLSPPEHEWSGQDKANFAVAVATAVFTGLIPIALYFYQRHKSREERLQYHLEQIANSTAMTVIGRFKKHCRDIGGTPSPHYAAVFRKNKAMGPITEEELDAVDHARRVLAGIWDSFVEDAKAGRVPAKYLRRFVLRGFGYEELVEPLDCANWYRIGLDATQGKWGRQCCMSASKTKLPDA